MITMKSKGKAVRGKVNSLAETAEEVGEMVTDTILSGSKAFRTSLLETTEEEKDTPEGVVKDTLNIVVETAETINGAVAESLRNNSKKIRKRILEDDSKA
ncbi:MAG: hypothetical protein H0S79_00160 [Anaerolineaceae bacterium]|nr:hypothetical protein [Anaerolineaceae bacterium]